MKNSIHVAVGFDTNYYNQFCVLAASLFANHPKGKIHLHAITAGLTATEEENITNYVNSYGKITFYEIDQELVEKFVLTGKWTLSVYYRLFFPLLLKDKVEKIIYLDTDIVVNNSLDSLYAINAENRPVAAVYDNWVKKQPLIGHHEEGEYFNSGMLLIDIPKWNELKVSEKSFEYLINHPDKIEYVDQCALNAVLKGKWFHLKPKFNFIHSYLPEEITQREINNLLKDVSVIHYTLDRPWKMLCRNRLRELYRMYYKLSPIKRQEPLINDFEWGKAPEWLKIRVVEWYFNHPVIKNSYRKVKKLSGVLFNF